MAWATDGGGQHVDHVRASVDQRVESLVERDGAPLLGVRLRALAIEIDDADQLDLGRELLDGCDVELADVTGADHACAKLLHRYFLSKISSTVAATSATRLDHVSSFIAADRATRAAGCAVGAARARRRRRTRSRVVAISAELRVTHDLRHRRRHDRQSRRKVLAQLERIHERHPRVDAIRNDADVEALAVRRQLIVRLLAEQMDVRQVADRGHVAQHLPDQRDRPLRARPCDLRDQLEIDPVAQRAVEADPRAGQGGEIVGHLRRVVECACEHRVIDAVRRHERIAVDRALGVGERTVDREHRVDLGEQRALGGSRLVAVEIAEHRPFVDAVVDREVLAERPDVVGRVRQERPQLEPRDPEPEPERANRRAQDLAVDRARGGAVRQR